jgi:hypothetical protein
MNNLLSFNQPSGTPHKTNLNKDNSKFTDIMFHQACGHGVDSLLIKAMNSQSLDNLSVVMIGLKGMLNAIEKAFTTKQNQSTPNKSKQKDL